MKCTEPTVSSHSPCKRGNVKHGSREREWARARARAATAKRRRALAVAYTQHKWRRRMVLDRDLSRKLALRWAACHCLPTPERKQEALHRKIQAGEGTRPAAVSASARRAR